MWGRAAEIREVPSRVSLRAGPGHPHIQPCHCARSRGIHPCGDVIGWRGSCDCAQDDEACHCVQGPAIPTFNHVIARVQPCHSARSRGIHPCGDVIGWRGSCDCAQDDEASKSSRRAPTRANVRGPVRKAPLAMNRACLRRLAPCRQLSSGCDPPPRRLAWAIAGQAGAADCDHASPCGRTSYTCRVRQSYIQRGTRGADWVFLDHRRAACE
jgi:hypothetical protein